MDRYRPVSEIALNYEYCNLILIPKNSKLQCTRWAYTSFDWNESAPAIVLCYILTVKRLNRQFSEWLPTETTWIIPTSVSVCDNL